MERSVIEPNRTHPNICQLNTTEPSEIQRIIEHKTSWGRQRDRALDLQIGGPEFSPALYAIWIWSR